MCLLLRWPDERNSMHSLNFISVMFRAFTYIGQLHCLLNRHVVPTLVQRCLTKFLSYGILMIIFAAIVCSCYSCGLFNLYISSSKEGSVELHNNWSIRSHITGAMLHMKYRCIFLISCLFSRLFIIYKPGARGIRRNISRSDNIFRGASP